MLLTFFRQLSSTSIQRHLLPSELTASALANPSGQASARTLRLRLLGSQRSPSAANDELRRRLSDAVDLSFSRSGGKGGQNVNKVNTKASLKVKLSKLKQHLPAYWISNLAQTHLYAPTSDSIVIQSSLTRSQASNVDDCWKKFYEALWAASEIGLVGETSAAQIEKVNRLKSVENSRRKAQKTHRKDIKANRTKPVF